MIGDVAGQVTALNSLAALYVRAGTRRRRNRCLRRRLICSSHRNRDVYLLVVVWLRFNYYDYERCSCDGRLNTCLMFILCIS